MYRLIFIIIVLFVITSFILQMIALLSNFNGLHSVYLARVDFAPTDSNSLFSTIWSIARTNDGIPSYFTLGIFVVCEITTTQETVCSPASFGYNYNANGILQTLENNIPQDAQSVLAKLQKGVFIPSVVVCFVLLCYSLFFLFSREHGICNYVLIELVSIISLLFCVATFAIQYIIFDQLTSRLKDEIFGSFISDYVTISTTRGRSVWLSLAAFILLFLTSLLLLVGCCIGRSHRKRKQHQEMRAIK